MDAATAQRIRHIAGNRCEYCRLPQQHSALQFHIEHIIARQHGGKEEFENLALACPECNLLKGPNLTSRDPDTGQITRLIHGGIDGTITSLIKPPASLAEPQPAARRFGCCE